MDVEDIERLCASLSFLENEGPVRILEDKLKMAAVQRISVSLVGKILTQKSVNREAFKIVIGKIWQVTKGMEIESLTGNIFSFSFVNQEDRRKVLFGASWTFDNALLVLEEPEGKGTVDSMAFKYCEFWIQIYKVPLLCASREIGWFLGEMLGEVVEVEGGMAGECVGKFMRVRVNIDISKPIRRCLRVDIMGDGVETIMLLRYERLSNFCFKCGRIGHASNECISEDRILVVNGVEKPLFGAWLKAEGISNASTSGRMTIANSNISAPVDLGGEERTEAWKAEAGKCVIADVAVTDEAKAVMDPVAEVSHQVGTLEKCLLQKEMVIDLGPTYKMEKGLYKLRKAEAHIEDNMDQERSNNTQVAGRSDLVVQGHIKPNPISRSGFDNNFKSNILGKKVWVRKSRESDIGNSRICSASVTGKHIDEGVIEVDESSQKKYRVVSMGDSDEREEYC
ncbi:hypothetical protein EZV62_005827 [Acer yangbiense]|uniref:CCHC-type domain-containing protein n=1 Tax=Acer yangbiense TaxID=1000413 RepID=A0A5C7IRD2_9ROSI|nr:hypothetical protein EZV62_005827 [Acer yangbiense]